MASLLDLYQSSGPPQSWGQADINLQTGALNTQAGEQVRRLNRNFSQYDLPDLVNSQAARGAFYSSATTNKTNRLQTAQNEAVGDIGSQLGFRLSDLANKGNALASGGSY
jgi:hypothetical protein